MDPHALAVALDELAILPPSALTSIGTLRRVHASLVAAGAPARAHGPPTDRTAPASGEDVERLQGEIFDACASAGAPSTGRRRPRREECEDGASPITRWTARTLRDGECVLEWAKKSLTRAAFRLDGASGRPAEARRAAAEERRGLDALRRATEALGADASGRTASDVAPQFKRLQSVRDEVVCRQLQAEALLWAARGETSDAAGRLDHGGPGGVPAGACRDDDRPSWRPTRDVVVPDEYFSG